MAKVKLKTNPHEIADMFFYETREECEAYYTNVLFHLFRTNPSLSPEDINGETMFDLVSVESFRDLNHLISLNRRADMNSVDSAGGTPQMLHPLIKNAFASYLEAFTAPVSDKADTKYLAGSVDMSLYLLCNTTRPKPGGRKPLQRGKHFKKTIAIGGVK